MKISTIEETRQQIEDKQLTLPDVARHFFKTIEEENDAINAVVSIDKEQALETAESIQQRMEAGTAGKLAGAVIGVKDLICEKDKPTTCASNILSNFESVYDATVIKRLKAEDALLVGRLNMDEFAMGSSNENSMHGPVRNPHNRDMVPGGSSGGSAAAVAANFFSAALGSDTGGSIRQPASYCGVVGLKPSYGRVSRHGLVAFASSFDCIGPLAHSVDEAAAILEVIAGQDENDNTTSSQPVPLFTKATEKPTADITVGVPEEYFTEGLDKEIEAGIKDHINELKKEGAKVVSISLPHMKYSIAAYYILATAEASSNLARYDGIRYGQRADLEEVEKDLANERKAIKEEMERLGAVGSKKVELAEKLDNIDSSLVRLYKKSRTAGFGDEVKRRIMLGTYVLSAGYYDAYYEKAQKVRRLIKQDFTEAFKKVDVIASPTAPTTAFAIGEKAEDPLQMYLNDLYTVSANLAGICGISVPAGKDSTGLPYGIQFMGDSFEEEKILNAGRLIEQMH